MSGLSINNASVIRHDYPPLESCVTSRAPITPGSVGIARRNPVPHRDESRSRPSKKPDLPQVLGKLCGWLGTAFTYLQRMLGRQRRSIAPHVPFVPRPEVRPQPRVAPQPHPQPTPVAATPGPQAGQLADLSSKRNGAKPDDVFGGFRQGPDGNCVTVSAIKAAMAKFGQSPTDIFKEVRKEPDGYQVTMRDGYTLHLSQQELKDAARGSMFVGRDKEVLKDAHFLFAVSAKRAQLENNDGYAARSFKHAVRSLNDGEDEYGPGEGLLRLGLSRHIESVPVSELAAGELGMVNRRGHSVAVINGVEEFYGRKGRSPRRGEAVALR